MGSSRFPGKALRELNSKTIIEHVYERASATGLETIVAIPDTNKDKPLEDHLNSCKIPFYKVANENNVANRYLETARKFKASHIMRITADCPMLNTELLLKLADLYQTRSFSYVSNVLPRTYPKGWDAEIFELDALYRAAKLGTKRDLEHVTPYIIREAMRWGTIGGLTQSVNESDINLCVDYLEDLERLSKLGLGPF